MEITKKVKKAINSVLLFLFGGTFSMLLVVGYQLSFFSSIAMAFIFMVMVIEDYMYLEIDVRILGILAFTGMFATNHGILPYIIFLLFGLLYYRIIYLSLLKCYPKAKVGVGSAVSSKSIILGFLPSLATAIAIYGFFLFKTMNDVPVILTDFRKYSYEIYVYAMTDPFIALIICAPLAGLWAFLEYRRYKAKKDGQEIIEMWGDGDVGVMAVWLAVLGLADISVVFTIAIAVHAMAIIYNKIKKNISFGGFD